MTENPLTSIYRERASWSSAYLDVSADVPDPRGMAAERRRSIRDALEKAGAPAVDIAAIEERLSESTGEQSPSCRYLLAREGTVQLDEALSGRPLAPEGAWFGTVPDLTPLIKHTPSSFDYIVAEVGRDGGEVRLYRAGSSDVAASEDVEGSTENINKVRTGGQAQSRYQRHTEDVWQHNMEDVATAIDRLVERHHPRLLLVAGDAQAVRLLRDRLSAASRGVLVEVDSNARADGASDVAVQDALATALGDIAAQDATAALDHLNKRSGQESAFGVGPVVSALQQAQAESLVIDTDALTERTLLALGSEPWIATAPEDALDAENLGEVPATAALIRAALLTDAAVVFATSADLSGTDVAAALRWPTGPATPRS